MANESVHIELNKMPAHEVDHMCRTVSAAVNRLLRDPKMQADFEAWRKARAGVKP